MDDKFESAAASKYTPEELQEKSRQKAIRGLLMKFFLKYFTAALVFCIIVCCADTVNTRLIILTGIIVSI